MSTKIRDFIPWYINHTLTEREQQWIAEGLREDTEVQAMLAAWQMIADAFTNQPIITPSPDVRQRLLAHIQQEKTGGSLQLHRTPQFQRPSKKPIGRYNALSSSQTGSIYCSKRALHLTSQTVSRMWSAFSFLSVTLAVFLLLCSIVRPGIMLKWSVTSAGGTSIYRVYRATGGSSDFELVGELTTQPGLAEYSFVDIWLLPGQTFTYFVEGINQRGQAASSQIVASNTLVALPGQLSLLITSALFSVLVFSLIEYFPRHHNSRLLPH